MRKKIIATAVILFLSTMSHPVYAGAQQQETEEGPDRWAFVVDIGYTGYSGNRSLALLTSGFSLTRLREKLFALELSGQVDYGRSKGEEIQRDLFGAIKLDLYPDADWSPFIFGTAQQDPFREMRIRVNGGMGAKYTFWRLPSGEVSISLAGLYSYEDHGVSIGSAIDQFEKKARLSWRLKGENNFPSGVRFSHVIFYQPRWNVWADYLIDARTTLRSKLSEKLSLTVSYTFTRDTRAPEGVNMDDHKLKTGLRISFEPCRPVLYIESLTSGKERTDSQSS